MLTAFHVGFPSAHVKSGLVIINEKFSSVLDGKIQALNTSSFLFAFHVSVAKSFAALNYPVLQ